MGSTNQRARKLDTVYHWLALAPTANQQMIAVSHVNNFPAHGFGGGAKKYKYLILGLI